MSKDNTCTIKELHDFCKKHYDNSLPSTACAKCPFFDDFDTYSCDIDYMICFSDRLEEVTKIVRGEK